MNKFVFAYYGGPTSMTREEGQAHMANWMAWMESLGDAVLDRGHAIGESQTATEAGTGKHGGAIPLTGYSVIQAQDMATALDMASVSPHIKVGGTIEVAPVLDMSM